MSEILYKKWPKAIQKEPIITVYPTSKETALNFGNLVFCVNLGRPKQSDIPDRLKEYFRKLGYKDKQRERGIPIMIHEERPYIESLRAARHLLANERKYSERIHAITVIPVDCWDDLILLKDNSHFLRTNGIHGISLLNQGEKFNPIRLGIIGGRELSLAL